MTDFRQFMPRWMIRAVIKYLEMRLGIAKFLLRMAEKYLLPEEH